MIGSALRTLALKVSAFLLVIGISLPAQSEVISGIIGFESSNGTPFTAFGGLNVVAGTSLQFSVTYDASTADANPAATIGQYNGAITEVTLTIGGSSVTLDNTSPLSAFDPNQSDITINTVANTLSIDIRAEANLVTFGQDSLVINLPLIGAFASDALSEVVNLNLSDFNTAAPNATAEINATTIVPFVLQDAFYDLEEAIINFPTSTPPTAMPEPATLPLLGAALLGLAWMRRRDRRSREA